MVLVALGLLLEPSLSVSLPSDLLEDQQASSTVFDFPILAIIDRKSS